MCSAMVCNTSRTGVSKALAERSTLSERGGLGFSVRLMKAIESKFKGNLSFNAFYSVYAALPCSTLLNLDSTDRAASRGVGNQEWLLCVLIYYAC